MPETIADLLDAHLADETAVVATISRCFERIREAGDPAIFISLRDESEVLAEANAIASDPSRRGPLFGIPFAVKDNIDVAGLPTTAACPAFSYSPAAHAVAVARLKQAGAIVIGKTNLDQFATGLVGVRSPYGTPRNAMRADLVPGGSSSGSAVAVARGIVPIALGTDTAGSGRVPAGLNNIVGLKPSVGLVPTTGVVPACRSLDCLSAFALTVDDAFATLSAMAGPDPRDGYSRSFSLGSPGPVPPVLRIAVPGTKDRLFFGDDAAATAFEAAIARVRSLGWSVVEVDLAPFLETARLLYEGAWVAERTAAVGDFILKHPQDVHPVTRAIIAPGAQFTAVDAFRNFYRLAELRQATNGILARVSALMVPTVPSAYTLADLEADPIGPNSRLGTYTNFVNLLDLAAIAVPSDILTDNTPIGVTFLGRAGEDARLAGVGSAYHAATGLPLGALGTGAAPPNSSADAPGRDEIAIAVAGAHLSGMQLNGELVALGGRFLEATVTSPDYRLFALTKAAPPKGAMLRVADGQGGAVAVEVWCLSVEAFGRLVSSVPPPLSIGTVRLKDGRSVKGFLAEPEGVAGAADVTSFGGWRAASAALTQGA